ncbi:hypothetical protein [Metabacillus arenae]|uniref:Uncharacterized protein n=1 Tax=Metabacillus arenae TaxID=2771434 RepID=A0A926NDL9_9BACI|nr:hypothetical protein [Metabacillus arenae]MBD1379210.1 hypothetical protein [Metabacillus arenae]
MGIKLARYRNTSYFARCFLSGGEKQYTWTGAKGNRIDIKEVPQEVFDYLSMNSQCFDNGELVIVEDTEESKQAKEHIADIESYENNTHTKEEIEKILKGNFPKMKKELNDITVDSEKQFVLSVAQEMQDELAKGKIDFLAEWLGIDSAILFD